MASNNSTTAGLSMVELSEAIGPAAGGGGGGGGGGGDAPHHCGILGFAHLCRHAHGRNMLADPEGFTEAVMEQNRRLSQQRQLFLAQRHHPEHQQRLAQLRLTKSKLRSRLSRCQVIRIIKLATMNKLRESGADDPTRQRLPTEGGPVGEGGGVGGGPGGVVGSGAGGAGGGGERGTGSGGGSDEYHHQFYNTGRIGRRNALPDILGTHCTTTTADLSAQLGALSTSDCAGKPTGGSGMLSSSITPPDSGQTPTTTGGT